MKRNAFKLLSIIFIVAFALSLCSCTILGMYLDSSASTDDNRVDKNEGLLISSIDVNSKGELIITYTNGSSQNFGRVVGQDGNVNVDINGNSNDASYAVAKGLRSAVSVQSSFNVYTQYGTVSSISAAGSGVIYKLDKETGSAFIITNYHVVFDKSSVNDNGIADNIYVYLYGSEYSDMKIPATYVGGSRNYDIAV